MGEIGVFQTKSLLIEAACFDGTNSDAIAVWSGGRVERDELGPRLSIATPYGQMQARTGDWIFKGPRGFVFPWKPLLFVTAFDPLSEQPADAELLRVREVATGRLGSIEYWGATQAWVRWDDGIDTVAAQTALEVLE